MKLKVISKKDVKYLKVIADVRYFEDTEVNGEVDEQGTLMPFIENEKWCPKIDLETGKIIGWPDGTTSNVHYKVCDAGIYKLLDENDNEVYSEDGYVPDIMCPEGGGYGDYIIMNIDADGTIQNWKADLFEFEPRLL